MIRVCLPVGRGDDPIMKNYLAINLQGAPVRDDQLIPVLRHRMTPPPRCKQSNVLR